MNTVHSFLKFLAIFKLLENKKKIMTNFAVFVDLY